MYTNIEEEKSHMKIIFSSLTFFKFIISPNKNKIDTFFLSLKK